MSRFPKSQSIREHAVCERKGGTSVKCCCKHCETCKNMLTIEKHFESTSHTKKCIFLFLHVQTWIVEKFGITELFIVWHKNPEKFPNNSSWESLEPRLILHWFVSLRVQLTMRKSSILSKKIQHKTQLAIVF